ncbi:hypothetical protein QJS10_CPA07g00450 [Acorus calamus]|uniref:Uncharacterized protein n=1 Tax=Acorus calamus TaxID=4465 RepID=A0AAV9EGD0_ACOCL|nr:hypothetical protein QJS10_CPA07g00450 [Acorus calamus]
MSDAQKYGIRTVYAPKKVNALLSNKFSVLNEVEVVSGPDGQPIPPVPSNAGSPLPPMEFASQLEVFLPSDLMPEISEISSGACSLKPKDSGKSHAIKLNSGGTQSSKADKNDSRDQGSSPRPEEKV